MTTGTKVFLALFALIVGVLVIYYGVAMPGRTDAANDGENVATDVGNPGASDSKQTNGTPADLQRLAQDESQKAPERSAPPPREPAPTAPSIHEGPPNVTAAGGLLSAGVDEANGRPESGGGVTPISPDAAASQNPAGGFLPLVGLNNGSLKPGD